MSTKYIKWLKLYQTFTLQGLSKYIKNGMFGTYKNIPSGNPGDQQNTRIDSGSRWSLPTTT
jgi:hypothetical protein